MTDINEIKTKCVFCSHEWTPKMEASLEYVTQDCDTCGHGAEACITFSIKCENCNRIVYKKEGKRVS